MLVRFAVDPPSILACPSDSPRGKGQHKALLLLWRRYGTLITDGSIDRSSLAQVVQQLGPQVRDLWRSAMADQPSLVGPDSWRGNVDDKSDPAVLSLSNVCDVAVVEHAAAVVGFEMDEATGAQVLPELNSMEVCVIDALAESAKFEAAMSLAVSSISSGTPTAEVWEKRFRPLVESGPKHVSVVDRYALKEHFGASQSQLSGLERFIRNLGRSKANPKYLTLYAAWPQDRHMTEQEIVDELRDCLKRNNDDVIRKFSVFLLPDAKFGSSSHGRFIRFGSSLWEIDVGLEVLSGPFVGRRAQAVFKTTFDDPSVFDCERALKVSGKQVEVI